MNIAREAVVDFFLQRHICLKDEWLNSVLRFLRENRISMENTDALSNLVYEQWLYSDINESMESTGEDINLTERLTSLKFPIILQIKSILDISSSFYSQVKAFTNDFIDNSGFEALPENEKESVQEAKPQRTLTLLLTNGTRDYKAIEFKPIKELSILTRPGAKVLLLPKMKCRRGKFLLEAWNFQLLGGDLDTYMEQYNPIKLMNKTLGIAEKNKKQKEPTEAETLAPTQVIPSTCNNDIYIDDNFVDEVPTAIVSPIKTQEVLMEEIVLKPNPLKRKTIDSMQNPKRIQSPPHFFENILEQDDGFPNFSRQTNEKPKSLIEKALGHEQSTQRRSPPQSALTRSNQTDTIFTKQPKPSITQMLGSKKSGDDSYTESSNPIKLMDKTLRIDDEIYIEDDFIEEEPTVVVSPIRTQEFSVEEIVLKPNSLKRKAIDPMQNPNKLQSPPHFFENILERESGFLNFTRESNERPKSMIAKVLGNTSFVDEQRSPPRSALTRKTMQKTSVNPFSLDNDETDTIFIKQPRPSIAQMLGSKKSGPEMIKIEKVGDKKNVALVTLNRPQALNAICAQLLNELSSSLKELDKDASIGTIVITGSQKAFAVGADIKEMTDRSYPSGGFLANWTGITEVGKPVIAAVNGYALGGGCELALMCDIIYAGDKAQFGQPEISIGTIPGSGGTQKWTRVAGKSMAMEVCLTGDNISAQEAKEIGLVSKVYPSECVVSEAVKLGEKISEHSPLIVRKCKEAVNSAYETTRTIASTNDYREGINSFTQKLASRRIS